MITTHFKQAWQQLRQNKLFSTIYITGTALAIASTTIFAVIYYVRLAPVYPEFKRQNISTVEGVSYDTERGSHTNFPGVSRQALENVFSKFENVRDVSGYLNNFVCDITADKKPTSVSVMLTYTDPAFFRIMDYDFLAGGPFSQDDHTYAVKKVAVSDQIASRFFPSPEEAVGKTISIDFTDYEICGVFVEGSAINRLSYAQAFVSFNTSGFVNFAPKDNPDAGPLKLIILSDNLSGVKEELAEYCRKFKATHDGREFNFHDQPRPAYVSALNPEPMAEFDLMKIIRFNALILLTLLIVPALNLSGLIASRMESRRGEIGIRKSFGANRRALLGQVLWENLFLTVIGGAAGLALTWLILSTDATFIFASIGAPLTATIDSSVNVRLTPDMMFAPAIFIFSFIICVVLNLMSAIIPAWNALRHPVVKSLK